MTLDPMLYHRFGGPPGALAADADRERAVDVLKAGFAEGRLTKSEYDDRVSRVYAARSYGELGSLTSDLPTGPYGGAVQYAGGPYPGAPYPAGPYPWPAAVQQRVNGMAVASLVCGIGTFLTMGVAAIPAIVLGHMARRTISRTGERGDGMALTGLILGWAGVALFALLATLAVVVAAHGHSVVINSKPGFPAGGFDPGNPGGPFNGG
jgi:hypothetical protein